MKEEELINLKLEIELLKMQNNLLSNELLKNNEDFNNYKRENLNKKIEINPVKYDCKYFKNELDFIKNLFNYTIKCAFNKGEVFDHGYEQRKTFVFGNNKLILAKQKYTINSTDAFKKILSDYNRFGINYILKSDYINLLSSKEKSNVITELSKDIRKKNPEHTLDICILAWIAFYFDPKPYRLKWFILRCADDKKTEFVKYLYSQYKAILELTDKEEDKISQLTNKEAEIEEDILYKLELTNKKILEQIKFIYNEILDFEKNNKELMVNKKLEREEEFYKREISDRTQLSNLLDEYYFYRKNEFENILVQNYLFNELNKKSFLLSGKTFNDYSITFDYDFLTVIFDYILSGNFCLVFELGRTKYSSFLEKVCSVIYKNGKENKIRYVVIDNIYNEPSDKHDDKNGINKFYVPLKEFILSENELYTFYDCSKIFKEESQRVVDNDKEIIILLNNDQKDILEHNYYIFLQLFLVYFVKLKITIIIDNYDKEVTKNMVSRWINECKTYDLFTKFEEKQLLNRNIAVMKIN